MLVCTLLEIHDAKPWKEPEAVPLVRQGRLPGFAMRSLIWLRLYRLPNEGCLYIKRGTPRRHFLFKAIIQRESTFEVFQGFEGIRFDGGLINLIIVLNCAWLTFEFFNCSVRSFSTWFVVEYVFQPLQRCMPPSTHQKFFVRGLELLYAPLFDALCHRCGQLLWGSVNGGHKFVVKINEAAIRLQADFGVPIVDEAESDQSWHCSALFY